MDTPLQTALRKAFDSKLSLIPQTLTPEQKAQVVKNLEGTFLPLLGGALNGPLAVKPDIWPAIAMLDNSGSLGLCGGSDGGSESGAKINLYGADNSGRGSLYIQAGRTNEYSRIDMSPDGALTQDGKDIEVVDSKGNKWIRFKSGLQLCWEHHINYDAKTASHNFPVPFARVPITLVDGLRLPYSHDWSETAINVSTSNANLTEYCWLAVGWWK